jgi:hypothetical protein
MTIVAGLTMEWKSVKKSKKGEAVSPKPEEKVEDVPTDTENAETDRSPPQTPEPLVSEKVGVQPNTREDGKGNE